MWIALCVALLLIYSGVSKKQIRSFILPLRILIGGKY